MKVQQPHACGVVHVLVTDSKRATRDRYHAKAWERPELGAYGETAEEAYERLKKLLEIRP